MNPVLKKTASFIIGTTVVLTAPVVPGKMELLYTEKVPAVDVGQYTIENGRIFAVYTAQIGTTTDTVRDILPSLASTTELGLTEVPLSYRAVSYFRDSDGTMYSKEIPLPQYNAMGQRGGDKNNPDKTELHSVISPLFARAAVAWASTTSNCNVTATSCTYSITIPSSGANPGLVVGAAGDVTSDLMSGATYNGAALTKVGSEKVSSRWVSLWYLTGTPTAGAHNLVITNSSSAYINENTVVVTGVNQTDFKDQSSTGGTGCSSGVTCTTTAITTTVDQDLILSTVHNKNFGTCTAATSTANYSAAGNNCLYMSSANRSIGSNSIGFSASSTEVWSVVTMGIQPPAGAPAATPPSAPTIIFYQ